MAVHWSTHCMRCPASGPGPWPGVTRRWRGRGTHERHCFTSVARGAGLSRVPCCTVFCRFASASALWLFAAALCRCSSSPAETFRFPIVPGAQCAKMAVGRAARPFGRELVATRGRGHSAGNG
eukprot:gene20368-biopygen16110